MSRLQMMSRLLLLLLFCTGCYRVPSKIEPQINYMVQDNYIKSLAAAFTPLSSVERNSSWGQEYTIGLAFARELDLYRAISTFKRAAILIPPKLIERKLEIDYFILYCFYLGNKYRDVIDTFESSSLRQVSTTFPAYHDLLIILYESYMKTGEEEKATGILEIIDEAYPETAKKLEVSTALTEGHIEALEQIRVDDPSLSELMASYEKEKKSVPRAQIYNALLPGAGYAYVGQKQSAFTAFTLNALFIAAAVEFFRHGYIAAGIITTTFESGWYFGGIYGAGEAAKLYNERIYEKKAYALLGSEKRFPILMLRYGF
ncbi:MAG: tetratricopeptide repeat protein [Simkaniaceae bacterium]|nr:tetratricopeptide repeat protein [Simkaniaceae bacterium]